MSANHPAVCFDCENAFDPDDMERLDDDEWRCHNCADDSRALFEQEQRDQKIDDPRR